MIFKDGIGRKFVACIGAQLINVVLVSAGVITVECYQTLTIFLLGGYAASNVIEKTK